MFDLKIINSVLDQLETERGIGREKVLEAIEFALASAYKKEYGKKGQIIKAKFSLDSGGVDFMQSKIVVDENSVIMEEDHESNETSGDHKEEMPTIDPTDARIRYNTEHHILIDEARLIKSNAQLDEEIVFPLEKRDDFGRIAAQTAKQVIIQKIREAEKTSVLAQFGQSEGDIVSGTVERMERGSVYLDMGRAVGFLPYEEQIPGEHFKQGERVRAYLLKVEDSHRGVFIKLSRSHPKFLEELFRLEVPEMSEGTVEVKAIAREAGSRSKIAVHSQDSHIDPVGSLVGQRGVRVSTIMSELGGEKIDIIEWSEDTSRFIEDALSPAAVTEVKIMGEDEDKRAKVLVGEDQQSLAIGKGGQNVRLAAKLTGWKIDIVSIGPDGEELEKTERPPRGEIPVVKPEESLDVAQGKQVEIKEEGVETLTTEASEVNVEENIEIENTEEK